MSDDPNLSEMKCLEHAGLFVWTLPVYDWLEVRAGSSRDDAHGEQTEKEIQAGIIEEFMDPVLGKDGPHFWEEVSFELENKSALLPHIENRFPTEEGGHDSTEARRIRLTDAGRRELGGSCLMYWMGYRSPGNGKRSLPDFVRVMDAEVIFLPDATAMCVLELTVGKLSEEEKQCLPKVGSRLGQDKTGSKGADETLPLEDLESVFCNTRRALVEGKTYVGPLHEQPQTPQVHSSEFPEHAKTLTELLKRVHGNAAGTDDDTPACNPFRLTELRDGLFGALCGAGSEITDWSRPMLYTMVRLTDPGTTGCSGATDAHGAGESRSSAWLTRIRTLSFRIANGFGARYPMSETADGLAVRIPLANRWFAASRSGAVTLCFDDGNDFHKQYMRRLRRDYFLIYLVALHQRHCLHELNDKSTCAPWLARWSGVGLARPILSSASRS